MEEDSDEIDGSVSISVELSGEYENVVDKLEKSGRRRPEHEVITADFGRLLETVDAIDGGTKSVIADRLPADMAVAYDGDTVVNALKVLEHYDLVVLEGNTWKIAP